MNTPTLGTCCSARIGRADIDVASRAVDTSSRARQLCYPRSNFLVNTNPQSRRIDGSLDLTFVTEIDLVTIPVRLAFALALYTGFLTRLSQPLGAIDTFSTACHPSQTVHQQLSSFRVSNAKFKKWCYIGVSTKSGDFASSDSHLRYIMNLTLQQLATVKFHGVFTSHWNSPAFAPEKSFRRVLVRDSSDLVTPFMQAVNQTARHFATLREL